MRPKIGLALSGGAARGIAHIGVLKVLEENNYPIDFIAGTSMGAIIAGAYAAGLSISQLEEIARSVRWRDVTRVNFSKLGLMSSEPLEQMLRRILPVTDFAKMRIPLSVVAADIQTGQPVIFSEGDAAHAIRISCTVPGFFTPVIDKQGRMLVDGGLAQNLPASIPLQMGADRVIAVDVNSSIEMESPPTNMFQIMMQSLMVIGRASSAHQALRAHLLVQPNAGRVRFDELERATDLLDAGERAMRQAMPAAWDLVEKKRDSFWVKLRYGLLTPRTRPAPAK
ncbi:MAG: patatin-like phospholipase family protein [Acidobacteriota bacterium]